MVKTIVDDKFFVSNNSVSDKWYKILWEMEKWPAINICSILLYVLKSLHEGPNNTRLFDGKFSSKKLIS